MDREMLMLHLRQVERLIAQGERHLAKQRAIVSQLTAGGHDSSDATTLLVHLEESQKMHVAHRARLREELGDTE